MSASDAETQQQEAAAAVMPEFAPTKDVTEAFAQVCGALPKGDMVRCPNFELSRAISAVEFFSPKMDVGLLPDSASPASHDLGFSKLSDKQVGEIVDLLWYQELLHLEGATQVQSIFTCLCLDPEQLAKCEKQHPVLYALLLHTLTFCDMNHALVSRTQVCFEEDYTLHSNYGIDLPTAEQQAKFAASTAVKTKAKAGPLADRIEFRRLLALASSKIEQCAFDEAQQLLRDCSAVLSKLTFVEDAAATEAKFFDAQCQLFRISPQPPKPTQPYAGGAFVQRRFAEIVQDLEQICTMRDHCATLVDLFHRVCWLSNRSTLNSFTRSRLFNVLIDKEQRACGTRTWNDLVVEDVAKGYGQFAVQALDMALPHTLQAVFETFRVLCHNPARQRRRLVHRIEEFGTLTQQFEIIDIKVGNLQPPSAASASVEVEAAAVADGTATALPGNEWSYAQKQAVREQYAYPLGNWGNEWCLRFMIRFMELGAMKTQMDLVRYHDVPNHLYYLFFLYHHLFEYEKRRQLAASPIHTALLELKRMLCVGEIQFLIGVKCAADAFDKQPKPVEFSFPRLQFEHRFQEPFGTVFLPKSLSCVEIYMAYNPSAVPPPPAKAIFDQAEGTFKSVRHACGQFPPAAVVAQSDEIKGFARLAAINGVNCAMAKSLLSSDADKANNKMQLDLAFGDFALGHVQFTVKKQEQ